MSSSNTFISTVALEIGIEALSSALRFKKTAGQVRISHEVIKQFPDLSDIVADMYRIRRQ
jgi:hypothetical protein